MYLVISMANIISFNVRGIAEVNKHRQIFNFICYKRADIALCQEMHPSGKMSRVWRNEWGGQKLFPHGATNSRGVAILFKHGANYKIHKVNRDDKGRILIIDITLDNQHITILNF